MKKWLIGLLLMLAIAFACIYIFIPSNIIVSTPQSVSNSQPAISRFLNTANGWSGFFLASQNNAETKQQQWFQYDECFFYPSNSSSNAAQILIVKNGDSIASHLIMLPFTKDSMELQWSCEIPAGNNLIGRIKNYTKALEIKATMVKILASFKTIASNDKLISGLAVKRQLVSDTLFIAKKMSFAAYPNTQQVYKIVKELQAYLTAQQALQTGQPMLHVVRTSPTNFEAMVALPTNKKLDGNAEISFKRMVVGLILSADITGTQTQVEDALLVMKNYITDHGFTEIALPFQSLITNREMETDSRKWVTRLYYPVY